MRDEIIYVTIHYACGHDACRPVFRYEHKHDPMNLSGDGREIYSPIRCKICAGMAVRAFELKMEKQRGFA